MKHDQFAAMKFDNGEIMYINAQYITSYAYAKENDETLIAVLAEGKELHFPGDQTHEIYVSINSMN